MYFNVPVTNELILDRLKVIGFDTPPYVESEREIYFTPKSALLVALDKGGERGMAFFESLCREQEKRGDAGSMAESKRSLAALEARARRAAKRVGLKAVKSKCRIAKQQWRMDRFKLVDTRRGFVVAGTNYDLPAIDIIIACNDLPESVVDILKGPTPRRLTSTDALGVQKGRSGEQI